MTAETGESFDVRDYARTAQASLREDLDLAGFRAAPLTPELVRVVTALARLEGATMAHLRNVLVTPTHKDARVTAFLVTWAFEKFWIADALGAVVEASGGDGLTAGAPDAGVHRDRATGGRGPVRRALAGFAQGWPVIGAHMTLGLVDDWLLRAAYDRVTAAAGSASLGTAVDRILAVKGRHTMFFDEEVHGRLAASPKAVRLARHELRRTGWPLGRSALDPADREFFAGFVFGGDEGDELAAAVERDLRDLPGIDARTAAIVREGLAG